LASEAIEVELFASDRDVFSSIIEDDLKIDLCSNHEFNIEDVPVIEFPSLRKSTTKSNNMNDAVEQIFRNFSCQTQGKKGGRVIRS
jgi:hypothetical protein